MTNIDFKSFEEKLFSLRGSKIISCQQTRLGGNLYHISMACHKEAFVKIGTGHEKLEIMREYRNISCLQGHLPVPKIYDYMITDNQIVIVLEKMPGVPFHSMISSLGRHNSFLIIKDIFNTIYNVPNDIKENFNVGIDQELKDIKSLIDCNKIKQDNFLKDSKGLSPKEALNKIKNDLETHTIQTLSHGDLCLPNILVTSKGKWSLIDWGKGGLGDPCRDLSALKGSLTRNMDSKAFTEVCKMMDIEVTPDFQNKIDFYKLIDLFWYHAILEN